jgi:hypothetical protein
MAGTGQQLPRYCRAARFRSQGAAGRSYEQAQELLYASPCDLSAYRFLLDQVAFVAVIDELPSEDLERKLMAILAAGESVSLHDDILKQLAARRAQATQLGAWVEGHHRPGKHL